MNNTVKKHRKVRILGTERNLSKMSAFLAKHRITQDWKGYLRDSEDNYVGYKTWDKDHMIYTFIIKE